MCLCMRCLCASVCSKSQITIGMVPSVLRLTCIASNPPSPPPLFAAFGWSYELRGWNQGLRCGWRTELRKLASVKGRALPRVLDEVEAEEQNALSTGGKRKAVSDVSMGSNKKKSMAAEEEPMSKAEAKWEKLEEEYKVDANAIVGKLAHLVTMSKQKGTVTRGPSTYSIPKLQAKLGVGICLPVAVGTSRITQLNCVFCPKRGEEGHEIGGECHSFPAGWHANFNSESKRKVVQADYLHADFR